MPDIEFPEVSSPPERERPKPPREVQRPDREKPIPEREKPSSQADKPKPERERSRTEREIRRGGSIERELPERKSRRDPAKLRDDIIKNRYSGDINKYYDEFTSFIRFGHTNTNDFKDNRKKLTIEKITDFVIEKIKGTISENIVEKGVEIVFGELSAKQLSFGFNYIADLLDPKITGSDTDPEIMVPQLEAFDLYLEHKDEIDKMNSKDIHDIIRATPHFKFKDLGDYDSQCIIP